MSSKTVVTSPLGIKLPIFSQAIIHNGIVYVSGNIGMEYDKMTLVEGSVTDQTRQAIVNMKNVLEEAKSALGNVIKANVYLTSMEDFAAMNKAWMEFFSDPMPARTCVGVKELPFQARVEIECIAHL